MSHESNFPAKPSVKVRGWVDPFHPQSTAFGCVMAGTTVADAISKACKVARTRKRYMRRGLVYLGRKTAQGKYKWTRIPQSAWNKVRLKPNDALTFRLLPEGGGGGKNPLRMILNIVVMAVAVMAAVFTAGASLFAVGGALAGATLTAGGLTVGGLIAGALVGGLVMTMGQMLVDKIAPIKQQSISTTAADQADVYSLSGSSNAIDRWGYVPILFGKGNFAPKKAAAPYSEFSGDDMYLHELFIWGECGTGDIKISNIKLGDTPIDEYDSVDVETWRFDPNNPKYSKYYPTGVFQTDESVAIKHKNEETGSTTNWIQRTTSDKVFPNRISVDIQFPALVRYDSSGNAKNCSVTFRIQYRVSGTSTWYDSYSTTSKGLVGGLDHVVTAKSSSAIRRTFILRQKDGTYVGDGKSIYDIRIRRVTEDHDTTSSDDQKIQDAATWTSLRLHTNDKPININYPVVMTAVRIKATDQLNGCISNLTGDYQVVMKNYNQTTKKWEMTATRDLIPAIRFALQECSARSQPDSVIDWDNFIETDAYWKEVGWKYDKVLDSQTSVLSMVQDICAAGLASPTFIDGKWAVIVDKPRKEPVMGITSANSWGWSVDRVTSELPHIIQCDFVNEKTWASDMMEVVVDDTYIDHGRTPIYEKVTFDGVTIPDNVYKQARFHYADARTQVRTISMTMWDESLIATRGDLVYLSQPYLITRAGLEAGRIKSVTLNDQGYVTKVTTDIPNTVGREDDLGIKIYLSDGGIAHARITPNYSSEGDITKTLTFVEPITANIERGNKYVMGRYGEEDSLAIITSMKFNADLTCQITCIDYVEDKYKVFDPDFPIPTFVSKVTKPVTSHSTLTPPPIVQHVYTDERALMAAGNTIRARAMFEFSTPANIDSRAVSIRGQYRLHNTLDGDDDEVISGKWITFMTSPISETVAYCNDVKEGEAYDFRFQYVSADGRTSDWTTVYKGHEPMVNIVVTGKTSPPPNVTGLTATADPNRGVILSWEAVPTLDIDHYSIVGVGIGGYTINPDDSISFNKDESVARKTIDTTFEIMPYGAEGALHYGVYAVDTLGNVSAQIATASVSGVPPETPVLTFTPTQEGGNISWQDCTSLWEISHYIVTEGAVRHETIDLYWSIEPRLAGNKYTFNVTAVDIYGNTSEAGVVNFYVDVPSFKSTDKVTITNKGTNIVFSWPDATTIFPIKYYTLYEGSTVIANVDATTYSMLAPATPSGTTNNTHSYSIVAVDIAGNKSAPLECSHTINAPEAPAVTVAIDGSQTLISWTAPESDMPISDYIVEHEWGTSSSSITNKEAVDKSYNALQAYIPALVAGFHRFKVIAINSIGMRGDAGVQDYVSSPPPPVTIDECSAVDNNVMVRYSVDASKVTWPIKEYRIYDVDNLGDNTLIRAELGRSDTQFFADIKVEGGYYIYGVVSIDVAGNESSMVTRAVTVNQPPNFILYTDKDSTFNGTKSNMLMDGVGGMYGPIAYDDTWATNVTRVASILSKSDSAVTWDDKVQNNMPYFFSPEGGNDLIGSYQEVIDVGTIVPSSLITVTVTSRTLHGSPVMTQKIETSPDNVTWSEVDTTGKALSKNFRYARITLEWSKGLVYVTDINFKMNATEKMDAGSVVFTDADYMVDDPVVRDENGNIDPDDTEPIGRVIYFNKDFIDIIAFIGLVVRGSEQKSAYIIFRDKPNPTWFRVFILDKHGNRAPGQIDWSVKGV